ncbi:MAG: ribosome biogenesis GTPase Der [Candidatus Eisenbacteria bacterium]|nr:ribosome biogenesis GTPase Der [Candidatus Eisenbacteria bacterium]
MENVKTPIVAIIGRPNVGKSTLFNRILGKRIAVTDNKPGVTRDRNFSLANWRGKSFYLVDTGGYIPTAGEGIELLVKRQAELAVDSAKLLLFVLDGKDGLTPLDEDITTALRRHAEKVILLVNKIDNEREERNAAEFARLGMGEALPVSSIHGRSIGELLDLVVEKLPEEEAPPDETGGIKVAVVGRQNVGKSSLVNKLLGEERVIVHELPGTTRDPIDSHISHKGRRLTLIDTAGLKKKSRIADEADLYSTFRSLSAIDRCDVALILLSSVEPISVQDMKIASLSEEAGKPAMLIINKWDLAAGADKDDYRRIIRTRMPTLSYLPVFFASALTGYGVNELLQRIIGLHDAAKNALTTSELTKCLEKAFKKYGPPAAKAKRPPRFYYATQTSTTPPTFLAFVNEPKSIGEGYRRYLIGNIREEFGFEGVPVILKFRRSE